MKLLCILGRIFFKSLQPQSEPRPQNISTQLRLRPHQSQSIVILLDIKDHNAAAI